MSRQWTVGGASGRHGDHAARRAGRERRTDTEGATDLDRRTAAGSASG